MKFIPILSAVLLLQCVCQAGDTAYQALRVLGRERTQVVLNRVIEVTGRDGSPQPVLWKIVLDDPSARGGVREFEVQGGHVTSERTPVHAYSGVANEAVMDFKVLNLDSTGAFTIANKEAAAARLGFDNVDYVLRCGDLNKAPVWVLKLMDDKKQNVGTIQISADTGAVVHRDGFGTAATGEVAGRPKGNDSDAYDDDQNGQKNGMRSKIKESFIHAGASVEEFFTGHRTLEQPRGD